MKNDVTRVAALRALFLLFIKESVAAFFYFQIDNPEVRPFIVGFAIVGVLSSAWVFTFVRTPESTRRKWYPLIYSVAAIAGVLGCCCVVALLIIGSSQGEVKWISVLQIPLGIYLTWHFWLKRQAALQDSAGMSD